MCDQASNASGDSKATVSEIQVRRRKITVQRVLSTGAFGFVWLCSCSPGVKIVVKFVPKDQSLSLRFSQRERLGEVQGSIGVRVGNEGDGISPLGHCHRSRLELELKRTVLSSAVAEAVLAADRDSPFLANVMFDQKLRSLSYEEPMANGTLFELAKNGPLRVATLRLFAGEIFMGMSALHAVGVMHRDLKLENVGINEAGHVRLCGFDYCYKFASLTDTTTMPYGTLSSQAPECFLRLPARFEPDFWAFGVVLMELLGERMYRSSSAEEIVNLVCDETIRVPFAHLGTPLGDLLSGLLTRNIDERVDAENVQSHPFFLQHSSWSQVLAQQESPLASWMAEAEDDRVEEVVNSGLAEERPHRVFSNTSTQEIVALTQQHPFIIHHFFDVPEIHGCLSFMEYLGNGDLFELASRGPLSVQTLRLFAAEIFLGMAALHDASCVHRDLKLENVGISRSGHVRLFDFDLCHRFSSAEETVTTESGTLTSSAPEVLMRKPARFEPDFWSFGVMLMELQDEYRFSTEAQEEIVRKICTEPYRIPGDIRRTVFGDLLAGLLTIDKEQRFKQADVRSHPFFASLDWADVLKLKLNPLEAWIADADYGSGYSVQDEAGLLEEITRLKAEVDVEDAASFQFQ